MGLAYSIAMALPLINVFGISSDGTIGMITPSIHYVEQSTNGFPARYIADWVFALPTIAFFMSAIGIFIISHFISRVLGYRRFKGPAVWQKLIASVRYLSYRGFHVRALRWNSAPVGVLLLGLAGTTFFFCELLSRLNSTLMCES